MYLQKDSLKIVEDYAVDFKFFAVLGYDTLPKEPFFVSGDYWNIQFCTMNAYSYPSRRIELIQQRSSKVPGLLLC